MGNGRDDFLGRGWSFPPAFDRGMAEIRMVEGDTDIRQSLAILFSTLPGERLMVPEYGCALHKLVFEAASDTLLTRIQTVIEDAILYFEPRIRLEAVNISRDVRVDGLLLISLEYTIIQTNARSNMVYPFYLTEGTNVGRID